VHRTHFLENKRFLKQFSVYGTLLKPSETIEDIHEDLLSKDSLFNGDVQCFQAINGYRFSIDAVLIAHFFKIQKEDRILDLGTGCGIIMLILLYRWGRTIQEIVGIELQQRLALLAKKNLLINNFQQSGRIVEGDIKNLRSFVKPESFDGVICNPPFFSLGSGRSSLSEEARLARHQILADIADFVCAAALAVRNKGRVCFIYPAGQIGVFITLLDKYRLVAKRMQFIYSYPDNQTSAGLVLIECSKNGGIGTEIMCPLYIYQEKNGPFTEELQRMYQRNN